MLGKVQAGEENQEGLAEMEAVAEVQEAVAEVKEARYCSVSTFGSVVCCGNRNQCTSRIQHG